MRLDDEAEVVDKGRRFSCLSAPDFVYVTSFVYLVKNTCAETLIL